MRESDVWPALRDYWHPMAFSEEVGDRPLAVQLLGEPIVLCRLNGRVSAFHDLCIHRGTPISLGWVEGETVVCAYHGWAYRADGQCIRIPSLPPEHPIPKKACLTAYRAEERYGLVWVTLGDEPRAPIPDLSVLEDPSIRLVVRDKRVWKCSAARAIEGFLDIAHFPWVHEGILGTRDNPRTPDMPTERNGDELRFVVENPPDKLHPIPYRRFYQLNRPFAASIERKEPNGNFEKLFFICTPHTDKECSRITLIGRNYEPESPETGKIEDLEELSIEQARHVAEKQRPEELPLDMTEQLHIRGPDAASIEFRKMLKELGVE